MPFKGAPGGDDYQNGWINPNDPNIILLASDQGAVVTLNGGQTVELLVQPADRAALSRQHRQRLPLSRLQRPAGERLGVRREPRQRRPDHVPRMAPGRRRGIRLRRPRSAQPRHRLRRQDHALRPAHDAERRTSARSPEAAAVRHPRRARRRYRTVRTQPVAFSPVDSAHAVLRATTTCGRPSTAGSTGRGSATIRRARPTTCRASIGKYADPSLVTQRGVIYTIAPSYVDVNRIWIGTDDGVIKTTRRRRQRPGRTSRRRR